MSAHSHDGSAIGLFFGFIAYWVNKAWDIIPHPSFIKIPFLDIEIPSEDIHDVLMSIVGAIAGWLVLKIFNFIWNKIFPNKKYEEIN